MGGKATRDPEPAPDRMPAPLDPGGFEAVLAASADLVVVVGPDRRVRWISDRALALGWDREDVVGRPSGDLLDERGRGLQDRAWKLLEAGDDLPGRYQMAVLRADGTAVDHDVSVVNLLRDPAVQGVVFTCRERVHDDGGVRDLLGTLQEGVIIVDLDGRVMDASEAALSLWGLSADDALRGRELGAMLSDRVTDTDGRPVRDGDHLFQQAIVKGVETSGEVRGYRHPDGSDRWLSVSTRVLGSGEDGRVAISVVDVTDRFAEERSLRDQVRHDPLTGLPNRSVLSERLQQLLDLRASGVAVLFLDLDDFKAVNDGYGHQAGDSVLRHAARRIQAAVRPGDLVARFGGDEFVVVCASCESADDALAVTDRIRSKVTGSCNVEGGQVELKASVGVAWVDSKRNGIDGSSVIDAADLALYRAKQREPGSRDLVVIRF